MASKNGIFVSLLLLIVKVSGLVELPPVEDNNILTTEIVIRNTINTLFSILQLKDVKKNPILKEYSVVHNYLISFTLQDYNNLKQIAKLTRVDKKTTNNDTVYFMAALNDLLNEDIAKEHKDLDVNNDNVSNYVKQFLAKLEKLKEEHGINSENVRIKNEVYEILKENEESSYNDTIDDNPNYKAEDEDSLLGENYFWKPDKSSRRVYRGERVKIKYFPFMASIQIFNQFYCSGSIIKNDLIISASSCLQLAHNNRFYRENPAFLSVNVGSTFFDGGENIAVMEVYFHPHYNPKNLRNNLCILRLVRKINLKRKRVKKIDFDRSPYPLPMTTDGITIIGWGAKGPSNIVRNPFHQQLAYAVLDYYPLRECQEVYSKEYVTNKNFCAGFFSKGGGACNRDVGGPGVVNGKLAGVVSFGSPVCGTPDAPTVFTKLGYYTDWIEEIIEQYIPSGYIRTTTKADREYFTFADHTMQETTFKIPPLAGSPEPLPIQEADALRMLQNSAVFNEFLASMFDDQDVVDYQDLVEKVADKNVTEKVNIMTLPTTEYFKPPTPIGEVDPIDHTDGDVEKVAPLDHIDDDAETVEPFDSSDDDDETVQEDMTTATPLPPAVVSKKHNSIVKIAKDANLEKDLVQLIDNINLKQIIEHISSMEGDNIVDKTKLMEMLGDKSIEATLSNTDNKVLTLLYLSDSEKNQRLGKSNQKDVKVGQGKVKEVDNNGDERGEDNDRKGMSIEAAPFGDLTLRSKLNMTLLNSLMPKFDFSRLDSNVKNANTDFKNN